jgi:hypothetical protein
MFESAIVPVSSPVIVPTVITTIAVVGTNVYRPVGIRIRSIGHIRHGRDVRVRTNVNRTRINRTQRYDYASVSLRGIETYKHDRQSKK